jgi:hypothetical protein
MVCSPYKCLPRTFRAGFWGMEVCSEDASFGDTAIGSCIVSRTRLSSERSRSRGVSSLQARVCYQNGHPRLVRGQHVPVESGFAPCRRSKLVLPTSKHTSRLPLHPGQMLSPETEQNPRASSMKSSPLSAASTSIHYHTSLAPNCSLRRGSPA